MIKDKRIPAQKIEKNKKVSKVLVFFLMILILQTVLILLIGYKVMTIPIQINSTKTELNEKININNAEIQGKINEITSNLIVLEEELELELNIIKAEASSDFTGIFNQAVDSVVTIQTDVSQGTGFIISEDGYLVTNAHVLTGARKANAITSDRIAKKLSLIGYDPTFDIALLKIEGTYQFLELGNSNNVEVGEKVIAIGNPLGLSFSASEGIVSAVNRPGANNLPVYIQTDTALNPGNSGGPLINTKGKVIGINNFKITGENLGFALESNQIKDTVNNIALNALNQTII